MLAGRNAIFLFYDRLVKDVTQKAAAVCGLHIFVLVADSYAVHAGNTREAVP